MVDCDLLHVISTNVRDRGEIRTRATEVTGALNQRLRPLGHSTMPYNEALKRVPVRVYQNYISDLESCLRVTCFLNFESYKIDNSLHFQTEREHVYFQMKEAYWIVPIPS